MSFLHIMQQKNACHFPQHWRWCLTAAQRWWEYILIGTTDKGKAAPSSVPAGKHGTEREKERDDRGREGARETRRKSGSGEEQTISMLISFALLPRNTNNAVPGEEAEANGDKAASSLTSGPPLICAESVAGWIHRKKKKKKKKTELQD